MKRNFSIILSILFLISIITLFGCSSKKNQTIPTSTIINETVPSIYTGEPIKKSTNSNTPFMVIVENSTLARPQSGLSDADVIYETSAEGGIPRFMALFHKNNPNNIGPVRSVRPYFLDLAIEKDLPFAHCGGSPEALSSISKDSSIMSINEITNGEYFWRDNNRSSPHNLYTSSKNILKSIEDKNFLSIPKPFSEFNKDYYSNTSLTSASNILLTLNQNYNTSYIYEDNLYKKLMDDKVSLDSNNNAELRFSNVVVQKTEISLKDDNIHLNINLIGSGTGYVFSNGVFVNVIWKKISESDQTKLYDINENLVPLSPGKTIWHIIDNNSNITFN